MSAKKNDLRQMVVGAIEGDYAISAETVSRLRAASEKEISTLKMVFSISIGLFNLMVWDILPTKIPIELRWVVGAGSLFVALFFPILGIRRHQRRLYQLADSPRNPKRARADEAGRRYFDKVKQQGRYFIRLETEILEGEPLSD